MQDKYWEKVQQSSPVTLEHIDLGELLLSKPGSNFPKMLVYDTVGDQNLDANGTMRQHCNRNGGMIQWNYKVSTDRKESFNMRHFPFDTQKIELILRNSSTAWITYDISVCGVSLANNVVDQLEWKVHVPIIRRGSYSPNNVTVMDVYISRSYSFYLNNIVILLLLIQLMSFASFLVPIDDVGDRANIIITLMLTTVAFKFSYADSIPKVPYQTYMDLYTITILVQLFFFFFFSCSPQSLFY